MLMPNWLYFGVILAVLGGYGGILGRLGRVLAPLGGLLGRLWPVLCATWRVLARLGRVWARLGRVLGASWRVLARKTSPNIKQPCARGDVGYMFTCLSLRIKENQKRSEGQLFERGGESALCCKWDTCLRAYPC